MMSNTPDDGQNHAHMNSNRQSDTPLWENSDLLREALAEATEAGFKRALANPETWAAASAGLREHASAQAGGWLMKRIAGAVSRAALWLLLGLVVYLTGGYTALVAFFKASH